MTLRRHAEAELAENRVPLEDLAEGDMVDGIIDHTNPYGIWVNVGAEVIGRLNVSRKFTHHLVPGQCIRDIIIQRVDLKETKLGLTLEDPEVLLRETVMISDLLRPGAKKQPDAPSVQPEWAEQATRKAERQDRHGRAEHRPGRGDIARSERKELGRSTEAPQLPAPSLPPSWPRPKPPSEVASEVRSTLQDSLETGSKLRVGQFVDGLVVEVSAKVVMVDIGLGHLAALAVAPSIRMQIQRGDEIQGMRVERVDWDDERQKGAVVLSLEDPELANGGSPHGPEEDWRPWSWSRWNSWDHAWDRWHDWNEADRSWWQWR
ncbi:unnamed protein product [Durusdinium trenchii]|uniref:S1 motif domain-containing protein n=1 Tax=Durusdinium trenchii TaxID=1381693 RepID=A0ABP0NBP3_9DINO